VGTFEKNDNAESSVRPPCRPAADKRRTAVPLESRFLPPSRRSFRLTEAAEAKEDEEGEKGEEDEEEDEADKSEEDGNDNPLLLPFTAPNANAFLPADTLRDSDLTIPSSGCPSGGEGRVEAVATRTPLRPTVLSPLPPAAPLCVDFSSSTRPTVHSAPSLPSLPAMPSLPVVVFVSPVSLVVLPLVLGLALVLLFSPLSVDDVTSLRSCLLVLVLVVELNGCAAVDNCCLFAALMTSRSPRVGDRKSAALCRLSLAYAWRRIRKGSLAYWMKLREAR
jgi:hypothetical protein